MIAAAAADRLSALPDDLLQHVLSFAPAKEAAASAVLSRQWRPLWRRTGVLNLDSRHYSAQDRYYACFNVFFRDAKAALAASRRRRLKRLTLFLTEGAYRLLNRYGDPEPKEDVRVAGLLADPAAAGLEELRIGSEEQNQCHKMYSPPLGSLPFAATLRVLELERCNLEPSARLAFPRLTDLTLRLCFALDIELDMPSLRSFRYSGYPLKLSLASPAPALARVDLDATRREHRIQQYEPTSRMLTSISSTRALKLRLDNIEDILAGGAILPTFPNLKLLQVYAKCKDRDRSTAVAVARLLASCPAMSELRLRLEMLYDYWYDTKDPAGDPFGESMHRFERLACMSSVHRNVVQLGGISGLPNALTNSKFSCLETTLRKVTLQFKAGEVNCFQVQLAKFLVENAMVLQEMHVDDDGSQFWSDHLHHKVARWRADAFQARNLPDTAGFRAYQLANPVIDPKKQSGYD